MDEEPDAHLGRLAQKPTLFDTAYLDQRFPNTFRIFKWPIHLELQKTDHNDITSEM